MRVINLNSRFDWTQSCEQIWDGIALKCAATSGLNLGDEAMSAVRGRLESLQWILLLDDASFEAQVEQCPHGEEERDESSDVDFRPREGGNREVKLYRRPHLLPGSGGIIEPLGFYVRDARAFAERAFTQPEWKRRYSKSEGEAVSDQMLSALLPEEIGNQPAIFLSPERLFEVPIELARWLRLGEPHPDPARNWTELCLRMTLLHEVGHHVFPSPVAESVVISEALANHFCAALLEADEVPWLFAKAWLLQPSVYLTWFIPHLCARVGLERVRDDWTALLHRSLGVPVATLSERATARPRLPAQRVGIPFSPQLRRAFRALLGELAGRRPLASAAEIETQLCDLGPFEEFSTQWQDQQVLLRFLTDERPSVACMAYRLLDAGGAGLSGEDVETALNLACDRFLRSDNLKLATQAFRSTRATRPEGLETRLKGVIESPVTSATVGPDAARRLAQTLCERGVNDSAQWQWLNKVVHRATFLAAADVCLHPNSTVPNFIAFAVLRPEFTKDAETQTRDLIVRALKLLKQRSNTLPNDFFESATSFAGSAGWDTASDKEWLLTFVQALSDDERAHMLLRASERGFWSLSIALMKTGADLSWHTVKTVGGAERADCDALHYALESHNAPERLIRCLGALPGALETRKANGSTRLQAAMAQSRSGGSVHILSSLPEDQARILWRVTLQANDARGLRHLLQKSAWQPSLSELQQMHDALPSPAGDACRAVLKQKLMPDAPTSESTVEPASKVTTRSAAQTQADKHGDMALIRRSAIKSGLATAENVDEVIYNLDLDAWRKLAGEKASDVSRVDFKPRQKHQ